MLQIKQCYSYIKEQLIFPINYNKSKKDVFYSFLVCMLLSIILIVIYVLVSLGFIPKLDEASYLITIFGVQLNNPITMVTYAFFHNNIDHLTSNIEFLFILGIPFFTYYDKKRGVFILFIIIFVSALCEAVLVKLYGIFLIIFYFFEDPNNPFYNPIIFINMFASGVGISSFLTGITIMLIPIFYSLLKRNYYEYKKNKANISYIEILSSVFYFFFLIPSIVLERFFADSFEFSSIVYNNIYFIKNNIFVDSITFIYNFLLQFNFYMGNPFLAHIWGMVVGLILSLWLIKNKMYLIDKKSNKTNNQS